MEWIKIVEPQSNRKHQTRNIVETIVKNYSARFIMIHWNRIVIDQFIAKLPLIESHYARENAGNKGISAW